MNMPKIQVKEDIMWMIQQELAQLWGKIHHIHFIGLNELVYLKINLNMYNLFTHYKITIPETGVKSHKNSITTHNSSTQHWLNI
jgi:hypothetical protein